MSILLSNGNGTIQARRTNTTRTQPRYVLAVAIGDLNGDGKLDIATADYTGDSISVLLRNGNGSFQAQRSFSVGNGPGDIAFGDLNGDGKLDIVVADGLAPPTPTVSVLIGNGNGTFQAKDAYSVAGGPSGVALADLNEDGALDIGVAEGGFSKFRVFLANTTSITALVGIDLRTQSGALSAMSVIDDALTSSANELASIGAVQSRLATAVANLLQTRENYDAAASRIMDADTAQEGAELVRGKILEEAASAILAQANQLPGLLLQLLTETEI